MDKLDINIFKANAVEVFDYTGPISFFKEKCHQDIITSITTCRKHYTLFSNFKFTSIWETLFGEPRIHTKVIYYGQLHRYHNIRIKKKKVIIIDD